MPSSSQCQPDFALGRSNMPFVLRLCIHIHRSAGAIHFLVQRQWYHGPIVLRLPQHGTLLRPDTDNFKWSVIDDESFSDRIYKRKEIIDEIRADHTNIAGVLYIVFRQETAGLQFISANRSNVGRKTSDVGVHVV